MSSARSSQPSGRATVAIHRGPIPGTIIGHHWFDAADGNRYGIWGWPHGANEGFSYEVVDAEGTTVDDSMFRLSDIREWAAWAPADDVTTTPVTAADDQLTVHRKG